MGIITDMGQDEKIKVLERRVRQLESRLNGGNEMSKLLETLVGQDVTIYIDFGEVKCRVLEVDDEWIKLLIYGKKNNTTVLRRVSDIAKVTLDKDGI